jgi:hypothetical protein
MCPGASPPRIAAQDGVMMARPRKSDDANTTDMLVRVAVLTLNDSTGAMKDPILLGRAVGSVSSRGSPLLLSSTLLSVLNLARTGPVETKQ